MCFEVDMAWKSGENALKSLFSEKLTLLSLKAPCALVSAKIFEGQRGFFLGTKSFL